MEQIREWATILCISSVTSGILIFLIPEGRLKKTAEIVVSLFLMVSLVSIFSGEFDFDKDKNNDFSVKTENYSVDFNDYLIEQSRSTVENLIVSELSGVCNNSFSVKTQWHVTDNTVCMDGIEISVDEKDMSKINVIKSKIGALTGVIPEVSVK